MKIIRTKFIREGENYGFYNPFFFKGRIGGKYYVQLTMPFFYGPLSKTIYESEKKPKQSDHNISSSLFFFLKGGLIYLSSPFLIIFLHITIPFVLQIDVFSSWKESDFSEKVSAIFTFIFSLIGIGYIISLLF